ncbi:hypothetical protein JL721_11849 [Aureococcus anophagefferens]|nr:hypothetical protein JL721_11849 [Aureococcus anophagefferens]
MDDVALLAPSYEAQALAEELWAWCWRFRAVREYAERQAAGVGDLALFRAVRPSREWRRTWILEQRAAGNWRETALRRHLGGTRLAPQAARPWAARGRERPGYCDLCGLYVRGTAADMAHVCLECPASRMARLDLDAPRRAWFASVNDAYGRQGREAAARWWRGARAPALSSCSDVGFAAFLAASGARAPARRPRELRDDLARAFASTFGEFFVARASRLRRFLRGARPDFVHISLFLSGVFLFYIDAAAGRAMDRVRVLPRRPGGHDESRRGVGVVKIAGGMRVDRGRVEFIGEHEGHLHLRRGPRRRGV